ncbi:hypothetical protein RJ640_013028 [Escallonia rubra]|uniref:Alkane hydroxylase MAH1-like n=1 Tax=Escallonia rubra TaxID=112253 RepID=A0AA88QY92_9ASTE|nr:hypothetical protein RJ640_013028 [Escallonia rubra]
MALSDAIWASMEYSQIIMAVICFFFLHRLSLSSGLPWNWPLVGMLPMMFLNFHRIYDKFTDILEMTNGVWFTDTDMLITADSANVQHIMSANVSNYPKGPESKKIFDVFGDVLFNSDHDEWKHHRKMSHSIFNDRRFHHFTPVINRGVLEKGLIPILEQVSKEGLEVDLQDIFERFMLDATCLMLTGYDPGSLRNGFPNVPFSRAMDDATEAIFVRHILPEKLWKLQKWLGIGQEKKMTRARETLDDIAADYIRKKQEQLRVSKDDDQEVFNTLRCFLTEDEAVGSTKHPYNVMRDTIIGLTFAGRDTVSVALAWFFWLLSENPLVESKIREELETNLSQNEASKCRFFFDIEELNKLVYLRGALCETLRLFAPIPFQIRTTAKTDTLPSGHRIKAKTKIVLCTYAVGRMKSIWGEDCLEFKPERWVSEKGGIVIEPSNKFLAFSSGPRICPGKELAFIRMKAVVAAIMHNYNIQVVKSHPVLPPTSIVLRLSMALKVKITKRGD